MEALGGVVFFVSHQHSQKRSCIQTNLPTLSLAGSKFGDNAQFLQLSPAAGEKKTLFINPIDIGNLNLSWFISPLDPHINDCPRLGVYPHYNNYPQYNSYETNFLIIASFAVLVGIVIYI